MYGCSLFPKCFDQIFIRTDEIVIIIIEIFFSLWKLNHLTPFRAEKQQIQNKNVRQFAPNQIYNDIHKWRIYVYNFSRPDNFGYSVGGVDASRLASNKSKYNSFCICKICARGFEMSNWGLHNNWWRCNCNNNWMRLLKSIRWSENELANFIKCSDNFYVSMNLICRALNLIFGSASGRKTESIEHKVPPAHTWMPIFLQFSVILENNKGILDDTCSNLDQFFFCWKMFMQKEEKWSKTMNYHIV